MLLLRRKTSQTHQIDLIEMLIQRPNDTTERTTKELLRLITISRRNGEPKTRDKRLSGWHVSQAVYYPT